MGNDLEHDMICRIEGGNFGAEIMDDIERLDNPLKEAHLHSKAISSLVSGSNYDPGLVRSFDAMNSLAIARAQEEKKELKKLAFYDELTGIGNRRLLGKKLIEVKSRASRQGEKYTVVEFDIDHFKNFNDIYGHDIGDEALKSFTNTIEGSIRPTDTLCREGGEEFYLILSCAGKRDASHVVSKILKKVEETPININGEKIKLTASAGIYVPKIGESDLVLKKKADLALYKAKESGRNQARVFYENRS